jgi:hypothetical protein
VNQAEDVCRQVYEETRSFYAQKAPQLGDSACGFRVLYGPPLIDAPFLFLGYQPGGEAAHMEPDHHQTWPVRCDYAVACWPLARRVRETWGGESSLERCTGLNAIFFRAPSVRAWHQLSRPLRVEMECFSLRRAERIVKALAPKRIVVIGLAMFDRLTERKGIVARQSDRRVLVKAGELWGRPAYGVIHLSGARVSNLDRDRIKAHFEPYVRTI